MKRRFSAPTVVNLEITEACNVKCRHCYNFWREDSMGGVSLDMASLDKVIDRMIEAGVFHVVLSGGEPFAKFKILEHGLHRLRDAGISISVNSNLMLANDEKVARLVDAGVDHILTSLNSHDPATNDYLLNQVGAHEKILKGIEATVRGGIRVSVNMIIQRTNFRQVYDTGRLVASLGCEKLFGTRSVPPVYSDTKQDDAYSLTAEETRGVLDDLLRVRDEFGVMVGSLVSYPLCFLGDLERYSDFVGRGCPSQSGHRMNINATGLVHACVHEAEGYGNCVEEPIRDIYARMSKWHDGSFHYQGCLECDYLGVCESGCAMAALGHSGNHSHRDPLYEGPQAIHTGFNLVRDETLYRDIAEDATFVAPPRLRFRPEDGFTLLNIRWANTIPVSDDVGQFLAARSQSGEPFALADFPGDADLLANLYYKDAVERPGVAVADTRNRKGLSINIEALPKRLWENPR